MIPSLETTVLVQNTKSVNIKIYGRYMPSNVVSSEGIQFYHYSLTLINHRTTPNVSEVSAEGGSASGGGARGPVPST